MSTGDFLTGIASLVGIMLAAAAGVAKWLNHMQDVIMITQTDVKDLEKRVARLEGERCKKGGADD